MAQKKSHHFTIMIEFTVKAGLRARFRSAQNAEYPQRFQLLNRKQDTIRWEFVGPNQIDGTYPSGTSFDLEVWDDAFFDFQIYCQFFLNGSWQNSTELIREFITDKKGKLILPQKGTGTLIEILANDSYNDRDFNDLIVQIDLANHFDGIPGLVQIPSGSGGGVHKGCSYDGGKTWGACR